MAVQASKQPRACGSCSLCCKVHEFEEIAKPAGQWCSLFAAGKGCTIHATRPDQCRTYQCTWTLNDAFDDAWRPDVAGFVMDVKPSQEVRISGDPDNPGAWKREPYYARLKAVSARLQPPYILVLVYERGRVSVVFPEAEIDLGPNQPGVQIDSGYDTKDGRRVPFAHFVSAAVSPALRIT